MPKKNSPEKTVKRTTKKVASKKSMSNAVAAKKPKRTSAAKPSKKSPAKSAPQAISGDDISRRAYFIAERRREMGWGGDETSDWVEAERQIKAEALEAARTLRPREPGKA